MGELEAILSGKYHSQPTAFHVACDSLLDIEKVVEHLLLAFLVDLPLWQCISERPGR